MVFLRSLSMIALIAIPASAISTSNQVKSLPAQAAVDPLIDQLRFQIADAKRMKAMVRIGNGPELAFIVDTGAERSAVSAETANALSLPQAGLLRVVSFDGTGDVQTVTIPELHIGGAKTKDVHALTFSREALGADGFLGVDSLKDKIVTFDFDNGEMRFEKATRRLDDDHGVTIGAERRDGRLVFAAARVDRVPTAMILDTGSDITVGNEALRRELTKRGQLGFIRKVRLLTTTGQVMRIDYTVIQSAQFGPVRIRNLPIAFSTVEPFQQLGLSNRPAMLLGMDALRAFGEVAVDFRRKQVHFAARQTSRQLASRFKY